MKRSRLKKGQKVMYVRMKGQPGYVTLLQPMMFYERKGYEKGMRE